ARRRARPPALAAPRARGSCGRAAGFGPCIRWHSRQRNRARAVNWSIRTVEPRFMVFANPSTEEIAQLLRSAHTIAVIGLSPDRTRPSHCVARALQRFGYRIIPVTPAAEVVMGEHAVPDLDHLPEVLGAGERVDIV